MKGEEESQNTLSSAFSALLKMKDQNSSMDGDE